MDQEFELYTPAASSKKTTTKNYPAVKIIGMIFGIIAAGLFIYYAADFTNQYIQQIAAVKEMGQPIDATTLAVIYFQIALTFLIGILPLVGAVLPGKCAKASVLLIASSISWGVVNTLPSIIIALAQGATVMDILTLIISCGGGLLALVSAILHAVIPQYEKAEAVAEFYTYTDDASEIEYDVTEAASEETSEVSEEIAEEAVEEVAEEVAPEAQEETTEE